MILALSFVSKVVIIVVAAILKNYLIQESLNDMFVLFERVQQEYLSNEAGNEALSFWNVYDRTRSNIPRTTTSLECYHRHLDTFFNTKQSSIITIVKVKK